MLCCETPALLRRDNSANDDFNHLREALFISGVPEPVFPLAVYSIPDVHPITSGDCIYTHKQPFIQQKIAIIQEHLNLTKSFFTALFTFLPPSA